MNLRPSCNLSCYVGPGWRSCPWDGFAGGTGSSLSCCCCTGCHGCVPGASPCPQGHHRVPWAWPCPSGVTMSPGHGHVPQASLCPLDITVSPGHGHVPRASPCPQESAQFPRLGSLLPEGAVQPELAVPSLLNVSLSVPLENDSAGIFKFKAESGPSRVGASGFLLGKSWLTWREGLGGDTCELQGAFSTQEHHLQFSFFLIKNPQTSLLRAVLFGGFFLTGFENW